MSSPTLESLAPIIQLKNFKPEPEAQQLMISGDLLDDNSWDTRTKVAIAESNLAVNQEFPLTLPPNSITAVLMKK